MKDFRDAQEIEYFPLSPSPGEATEAGADVRDHEPRRLPDGWREISTGSPGARLYCVAPPYEGGAPHWEAEMTLNGRVRRRRCASEIHAHWWLAVLDESGEILPAPDAEELNESLRASFSHAK